MGAAFQPRVGFIAATVIAAGKPLPQAKPIRRSPKSKVFEIRQGDGNAFTFILYIEPK